MKLEYQVTTMFESAQFEKRSQKLAEEIFITKEATSDLENKLFKVQTNWGLYYEAALREIKSRLEEIDVATMLRLIEQQASDIQINHELETIIDDINFIEQEIA